MYSPLFFFNRTNTLKVKGRGLAMSYKNKIRRTAATSIAVGTISGVVVQLICGAIITVLVEKGSVPEGNISLATLAGRSISLAVALIITWWLSPDKKLVDLMITCGSLLVLPVVLALFFWNVDVGSVALNMVISMAMLGCGFWLLNQNKKGKNRYWRKKGYR